MTATVVDPRSLTKEKLKSELSNHNITLPSSDSRKDVYVELYRQHILPVVTSSAVGKTRKVDKARLEAFSSDEDDSQDSTKYSPKRMSGQIDPIVPEEVDGLTDDELFMALARRGETVGPIVDSTRRVYQKRLKKQLTEEMEADQEYTNGHEESGPDDDFSDQEEPMETEPLPVYNMPTTRFRLDERPKPFEPIAKRESAATTDARVSTFSTDVPVITHRTSHKFTKFTSDDGRGRQEKVVTHVDEVSEQTLKNIDSQHKQLQRRQGMSLWLQLSIIGVCALVVFLVLTNMEPAYQPPEIGEQ